MLKVMLTSGNNVYTQNMVDVIISRKTLNAKKKMPSDRKSNLWIENAY